MQCYQSVKITQMLDCRNNRDNLFAWQKCYRPQDSVDAVETKCRAKTFE